MPKKNIIPINEKIRAEEVMLIGANGKKMGILPFSEALKSASEASLDLVQVSPSDSNPVVCKLLIGIGGGEFWAKGRLYC